VFYTCSLTYCTVLTMVVLKIKVLEDAVREVDSKGVFVLRCGPRED